MAGAAAERPRPQESSARSTSGGGAEWRGEARCGKEAAILDAPAPESRALLCSLWDALFSRRLFNLKFNSIKIANYCTFYFLYCIPPITARPSILRRKHHNLTYRDQVLLLINQHSLSWQEAQAMLAKRSDGGIEHLTHALNGVNLRM